jgi:adenylate cyclase class 2
MYEVEAKVPLTSSDFKRLQKAVQKMAKFQGKSLKKDTYYADTKAIHMRMRNEEKKNVFCIKNKALINGVEANTEMEWGIKDEKKWKEIMKKSGIKPNLRKTKKTESYRYKNFTIELNHVAKLGYFLEIETIVEKKEDISGAKKELIDLFKGLGYSQKAFEKRYYIELLSLKK